MKKKILLTRPHKSSEHWASLMAARGFDCVIEPLLIIKPIDAPRPEGPFQAVVLTSSNALENTDLPLTDLLPLPCFCVGASTGEAARAFGFTDIRCGTSDSAVLAHLIIATLTDKALPLLHIAGNVVDGKAHNLLAQNGFTLIPWIVYQAQPVDDFTPTTRDQFAAGEFGTLPVFSPRSARLLISIIEKNNLHDACRSITAIALSQAVANVLQILPWQYLYVAATPAEKDVLTCLLKSQSEI